MDVTDATREQWRAEAANQDLPAAGRCSNCRSFEALPRPANGVYLPPHGVCQQLQQEVDRPNTTRCSGWQSNVGPMRDRARVEALKARDQKAEADRRIESIRQELGRRAPRVKILRRIVGMAALLLATTLPAQTGSVRYLGGSCGTMHSPSLAMDRPVVGRHMLVWWSAPRITGVRSVMSLGAFDPKMPFGKTCVLHAWPLACLDYGDKVSALFLIPNDRSIAGRKIYMQLAVTAPAINGVDLSDGAELTVGAK